MTHRYVINGISSVMSSNAGVGVMLRLAISSILTRDDSQEEILKVPGCLLVRMVRTGEPALIPPQTRRGHTAFKNAAWNQLFEDRVMALIRSQRPDLLSLLGPTEETKNKKQKSVKFENLELEEGEEG